MRVRHHGGIENENAINKTKLAKENVNFDNCIYLFSSLENKTINFFYLGTP